MYSLLYIKYSKQYRGHAIQYQEKRCIVYLASNAVISSLYGLYIFMTYGQTLFQNQDNRPLWAAIILIYIPVMIVSRIFITIVFSIINKIVTDDVVMTADDELDRLIDLKATRQFYNVFLGGIVLALASQALGLPLQWLFVGIGLSMTLAGITGDLIQLILYSRGI